MSELIRAKELIGLPVVSRTTGEDVAEVRDVVYDSEQHELIGFTLNKRGMMAGRLQSVLTASALAAVGPDAVMSDDESALTDPATAPPAMTRLETGSPVLHDTVLTDDGNDLGEVLSVILSLGSAPRAVGYEVSTPGEEGTRFVPITQQMALSGEHLVVPGGAQEYARDLETFAASLDAGNGHDEEDQ
ncbi:hypothetical protein BH24ACT5_BH24ACT5_10470 [soil metagenome]